MEETAIFYNDVHRWRLQVLQAGALDDVGQLIEQMIGLEEAFQGAMTLGIQAYSRPLSFHLLTPAEHGGLFQNVEKVIARTLNIYGLHSIVYQPMCTENLLSPDPQMSVQYLYRTLCVDRLLDNIY